MQLFKREFIDIEGGNHMWDVKVGKMVVFGGTPICGYSNI